MNYTIPKGRHRALPPRLGILYNPHIMRRKVTFTDSCRYELPSIEQKDTNKLFGWGYLNGGHHKDSARFGWWYNPLTGLVHLAAYCYVKGERKTKPITTMRIDETAVLEIAKYDLNYVFRVNGIELVRVNTRMHKKKWAYPLGLYFGGNLVSPHNMKVKIEKP